MCKLSFHRAIKTILEDFSIIHQSFSTDDLVIFHFHNTTGIEQGLWQIWNSQNSKPLPIPLGWHQPRIAKYRHNLDRPKQFHLIVFRMTLLKLVSDVMYAGLKNEAIWTFNNKERKWQKWKALNVCLKLLSRALYSNALNKYVIMTIVPSNSSIFSW